MSLHHGFTGLAANVYTTHVAHDMIRGTLTLFANHFYSEKDN